MKARRRWTPGQTFVRDQILTMLRECGEQPAGEIGRKLAVYDRKQSSGRTTNDLLVLVTAGLVQVRNGEPRTDSRGRMKPGAKLWSLTDAAADLFVDISDMPPLDVADGEQGAAARIGDI